MRQIGFSLATFAGIIVWSGLVLSGGAQLREAGEETEFTVSGDDLAAMSAESAEAQAVLAQTQTEETDAANGGASPPDPASEPAPSGEDAATEPSRLENNTARPVQPDAFNYPVANGSAPLERIPAKERLLPAKKEPVLLARPSALKAGVVTVRNRSLQLAGITPTELGRTCTGTSGQEWPCGVIARTAMRLFLRHRTIACELPDEDWKSGSIANCTLGDIDIATWLASNGWVEVPAGSTLKPLEEAARKAGEGLFGDDPRLDGKSGETP